MPKTRNVLKYLSIEQAKGKRMCHVNSKHTIEAGEFHLAQETAPMVRENICVVCAGKIFDVLSGPYSQDNKGSSLR